MFRKRVVRYFSSCQSFMKSNDDWKKTQRMIKRQQNKRWRDVSQSTPFRPGIRHHAALLDLDVEGREIAEQFDTTEVIDDADALDKVWERSANLRRDVGDKVGNGALTGDALRRVLTKKNFFREEQSPQLLTWMEKITMQCLNQTDPVKWSAQTLAESFPATPTIVSRVLQARGRLPPDKIRSHDATIRENWQKLAYGELEISPDLKAHISHHWNNKFESLLAPERFEIDQTIIDRYAQSLMPPSLPTNGPWGRIISDYHARLKALNSGNTDDSGSKAEDAINSYVSVASGHDVFSKKSEYDPAIDVASPYRDTAILKGGADETTFRRDKPTTMTDFMAEVGRQYMAKKLLNDNTDNNQQTRGPSHKKPTPMRTSRFEGKRQLQSDFTAWLAEQQDTDKVSSTRIQSLDVERLLTEELVMDIPETADTPSVNNTGGDTRQKHVSGNFAKRQSSFSRQRKTHKSDDGNGSQQSERRQQDQQQLKVDEQHCCWSDDGELVFRVPVETMGM